MPLPPELIKDAREYLRKAREFSIGGFTHANPAWADKLSYHCGDEEDEGTHDAYALMEALADEFDFTEDGWDSFLADAKLPATP